MSTSSRPSMKIAPRRQLVDNTPQAQCAHELGRLDRSSPESFCDVRRDLCIPNGTTTTIESASAKPQRLLIDYTKQGRSIPRLGSGARFPVESILTVKSDSRVQSFKSMKSDGIPSSFHSSYSSIGTCDSVFVGDGDREVSDRTGESILPRKPDSPVGNVKSVKSVGIPSAFHLSFSSIGTCDSLLGDDEVDDKAGESIIPGKSDSRIVHFKSIKSDGFSSAFHSSFSSSGTCDSMLDDEEKSGRTKDAEDDDGTVEFFLRIPPRSSRLLRSSDTDLRERFRRQPKSKKTGNGVIRRLLREPPARSLSAPVLCTK